jgi:DDE_Tnp_1-associated
MSSSPIAELLPHGPVTSAEPAAVTDHEQPGLLAVLAAVPDPRDPRGVRSPLTSVLAVAVCAVLAGAVTFAAIVDWVRDLDAVAWARLGFTDRIPVASTVWRLLVRVDADVLSTVLAGWLRARTTPAIMPPITDRRWRRVIAVDGKVLRGSRLHDGNQVHLLSAYDTGTGVVLAQVQIAAKSK